MKTLKAKGYCQPRTIWCTLDAWLRCNVAFVCRKHSATIKH